MYPVLRSNATLENVLNNDCFTPSMKQSFLYQIQIHSNMKYKLTIVFILSLSLVYLRAQDSKVECFENEKTAFNIIDKSYENHVIFLGIAHGVDFNYEILSDLIKFFNGKNGLRHIICEESHGEAFLYNAYLETGNEYYLKYTDEWSDEKLKAFKKLRIFNNSLPQDKKLFFVGIDALTRIDPVVQTLKYLFNRHEEPSLRIKPFVDSIRNLNMPIAYIKSGKRDEYLAELNKRFQFLRNEIQSSINDYKSFLREDFIHIQLIISNNSNHTKPKQRNKEAVKNLNDAVNLLNIKTGAIGMFGVNHTSFDSPFSIASNIKNKKTNFFYNRVVSFNIHYVNTKSNYYKVVDVTSRILSNPLAISLSKIAGCDKFIFKVPDDKKDFTSLKNNCDYLVYCNNGNPIKLIQ
jgi:hypothetical protein